LADLLNGGDVVIAAASVASGPGGLLPPDDGEVARLAGDLAADLAPRYHLLGYISRGAFASVWRALDRQTLQTVAIKRFDPSRADRGRDFYRELRALFRLRHPHVVQALNFIETAGGSRCLVLEYCDGGSLRSVLRQRCGRPAIVGPEPAVRIVAQMAEALAAAHALGIVHRDLKPENVLIAGAASLATQLRRSAALGPENRTVVKVADFGLARPKSAWGSDGALAGLTGSPTYMAPEQFTGKFSPASDVYALGVVAWELVRGRPPFTGGPDELARLHLYAPLPVLTADDPWDELLPAMLSKDPNERPTAAAIARRLGRPEEPMHDFETQKALEAEEATLWRELAALGEFSSPVGGISTAETLTGFEAVRETPEPETPGPRPASAPLFTPTSATVRASKPAPAPASATRLDDAPPAVGGFFDSFGWHTPADGQTAIPNTTENRHDAFGSFQWD
jgi:serine/threonine-protein kinase